MGIQVVNEPPPEESSESGRTRRDVLVKGAAGLGVLAGGPLLAACGGSASSSSSGSASGGSSGGAQKLRVLGIGVDQNPALKAQAKKDLNIDLEYTITDTPTTDAEVDHPAAELRRRPPVRSPDTADSCPAGVIQPVDTSKIPGWTGGTHAVERPVDRAHEPVGVGPGVPEPEADPGGSRPC